MASVAVVIPAGGVGARFGGRTPKQFLRFGATPILAITVRHFATHPAVGAIVVAAPEGYVARARRILAPVSRRTPLTVVAGGGPRPGSVGVPPPAGAPPGPAPPRPPPPPPPPPPHTLAAGGAPPP